MEETNKKELEVFDVTIPREMTKIFVILLLVMAGLGIIFTVMFFMNFGQVTKGNIYVFVVLAAIIVVFLLHLVSWRMKICKNEVIVNGIYRRKRTFHFSEIEKIVVGKKLELEVYVSGKKVTTIDQMCTNYDEFFEMAERRGIEIKKR